MADNLDLQLEINSNSFVGSLHITSIIINAVSLLMFPRISRVTSSEVIILMGSLALLTLVANGFIILHVFRLISGTDTKTFVAMGCFHVPIFFTLFPPAILAKSTNVFGIRTKASLCFCDISYTLLWVGCVIHAVMLLSPIKAFDYHRFDSGRMVSETSSELSTEVSVPQLMLVGAVPQAISVLLTIKILSEIKKFRKALTAQLSSSAAAPKTPDAIVFTRNRYFAAYLWRWGFVSVLLIAPSCLISVLTSVAYFKKDLEVPRLISQTQGVVDSLIFFTQPLCVLLSWLIIDPKRISEPQLVQLKVEPSNPVQMATHSVQNVQNGSIIHVSLTPSPSSENSAVTSPENFIQSQV